MPKELLSRLRESVTSIGPFFLLILAIHFTGLFMVGSPDPAGSSAIGSVFQSGYYSHYGEYVFTPSFLVFLIAFPLMVFGMSLFGIGADQAMEKMGAAVGASLTKKRSIILLAVASLLIGALVTFAEPDLTIFSTQLMGEQGKYVLIIIISLGVGLLLALAFVRIIFQWDYRLILALIFAVVFGLGCFVNREAFFPIVFDSAGVTIGSITVPFVLAMGISVAQIRGSRNAEDDSFGLTGLAGLGPLITCMIWAKIMDEIVPAGNFAEYFGGLVEVTDALAYGPTQFAQLGSVYAAEAGGAALDILLGLAPLAGLFIIYDFAVLHLDWKHRLKIFVGLVETYVGLFIFMIGVNTGFMPVARQLGRAFGSTGYQDNFYAVILMCLAIGTLIILAEPSVHILGKQVEEVSQGSIKTRDLYVALCLGVGLAVLMCVLRVQYLIDMRYMAIPMMLLSLLLAMFSPKIFTALAFDSAGIASSTMASAFILPMVVSMATARFPNNTEQVLSYGTGVVGMVFLCPLVAILILGIVGRCKAQVRLAINRRRVVEFDDSQVVHLPCGEPNVETGGAR